MLKINKLHEPPFCIIIPRKTSTDQMRSVVLIGQYSVTKIGKLKGDNSKIIPGDLGRPGPDLAHFDQAMTGDVGKTIGLIFGRSRATWALKG